MPNYEHKHDIAETTAIGPVFWRTPDGAPPAWWYLHDDEGQYDPGRYEWELARERGLRLPRYRPPDRDELLAGGLVLMREPNDPDGWIATGLVGPWGERLPLPEPDPEPPSPETWVDHPDLDLLGLRPARPGADGRPLTLEDAAALPDPERLVAGLLIENELGVLYGEPKAGKTFAAIDMALCVATGTPFHSLAVGPPRPVVYVIAEGNPKLFAQRCEAWRRKHGIDRTPNFRFIAARIPMGDRREVRERLTAHLAPGTALAVIDTLTRNLDGDENSPKDMAAFVAGCDDLREATGAAVLVVHHAGKTPGRGPMGHTRLAAALDTSMKMSSEKSGVRTFRVEHQRNGPGDAELAFRIVDGPTLECVRSGRQETDAQFADFQDDATADQATRVRRLAATMDGGQKGEVIAAVAAMLGVSDQPARAAVAEAVPTGSDHAVEFEGMRLWLERLSGRSTVMRAEPVAD